MKIAEFLPAIPNRLWDLAAQMGVSDAICKCAPDLTGLKAPDDFDSSTSALPSEVSRWLVWRATSST
jgi:hypothetical protein